MGQAAILTRGPSTHLPYWFIETTCRTPCQPYPIISNLKPNIRVLPRTIHGEACCPTMYLLFFLGTVYIADIIYQVR